jgi:hypothetical protein
MGWVVNAMPRPLCPWKRHPIPTVQIGGQPQGRPGRERKISPPLGFDPRTDQPVASRYADYAIPAPDRYQDYNQSVTPTHQAARCHGITSAQPLSAYYSVCVCVCIQETLRKHF